MSALDTNTLLYEEKDLKVPSLEELKNSMILFTHKEF